MNIQSASRFRNSFQPLMVFLAILGALSVFSINYTNSPDMKWLGIVALSILSVGMGAGVLQNNSIRLDRLDQLAVAFFLYSVASLLWASDRLTGAYFLAHFVPLWIIFTFFKNSAGETLRKSAAWAIALAGVVALAAHFLQGHIIQPIWPELSADGPIAISEPIWAGYFNYNFMTELLLLTVPFLAALAFYKKFRIFPGVLLIGALLFEIYFLVVANPSKIEFLVIPGAALVFALAKCWRYSRKLTWILALSAITAIGAGVVHYWNHQFGFASNTIQISVIPRAVMFWNAGAMWIDHPLLGLGAGGFSAAEPLYYESFFNRWPELGQMALNLFSKFQISGAVHNEYIQFLVEFGLAGLTVVFLFARTLAKAIGQSSPMDALTKGSLAVMLFAGFNAFVEFPLQQAATALVITIALGLIANHARENLPVTEIRSGKLLRFGINASTITFIGIIILMAYRYDSAQRNMGRTLILHDTDPVSAYDHNLRAYRQNPLDPIPRIMLYQSLHQWNLATGTPPLPPPKNDEIFNISLSAGPQELLLVRRVQYLLDTGRYKSSEGKKEVDHWLGHLRKHSHFRTDVWIADAYYQHLTGNQNEATKSINKAMKLPRDIAQDQQLFALTNMVLGVKKQDRAFPLE